MAQLQHPAQRANGRDPTAMRTASIRTLIRHTTALALLAGAGLTAPAQDRSAGTAPAPPLRLAGLKQPAEILVDRWGVAHLYAADQDDLFLLQGFNAARDRLFQIDLWRRRGLGRLSAALGPSFVEQDKAARLFLYRGDMAAEWQAYGPDAQRIAQQFVAGINAYIDQLGTDPARLPLEFRTFGYTPEKWQAQDLVQIRSHGLTRNLESEVARAYAACHADLKADRIRVRLAPKWETRLPAGTDPCLPPDLLRLFHLATRAVAMGRAAAPASGAKAPAVSLAAPPATAQGSNAWVVAPARSTTGRPILANDPHRAYSAPSLRYITHLSTPGLDVIGAGEPALPGISIGHNGSIAFGLTIFSIDQEDLYVYRTNPANPLEYQYKGQWEKFTTLRQEIPVRGTAPQSTELLFTRHGPVIHVEPDKQRAFAVRAGWFQPGMAPYFGSVNYLRAQDFGQFKAAMQHWGAPAVNQVYADARGNIGWVSGGLAPVRPTWDGLLPVPGDGRHEWAGFLPGEQLPSLYNPAPGWFASANEMNLPLGYPYRERKLGFEWPPSDRHSRLSEVLGRGAKVSIEDAMRLQNDLLSIPARRLIGLLARTPLSDSDNRRALQLLRGWDFMEAADSPQAALFEVWWSRYLPALYKQALLGPAAAAATGAPDSGAMLDALERPEAEFGADAQARRNQVLAQSLKLAWLDTQRLLGPDPAQWRWGRLHHALMPHAFAAAVDDATRARLNVGPFAKGGGGSTPNLSSFDPRDFRQIGGPSFRIVVDVGNWDNSHAVNAPGQSGDPDSPHYRDLAALWLRGDYFPLLYSRKAVEAATVRRIELQPLQK